MVRAQATDEVLRDVLNSPQRQMLACRQASRQENEHLGSPRRRRTRIGGDRLPVLFGHHDSENTPVASTTTSASAARIHTVRSSQSEIYPA